ncbi:MAG TPA: DUF2344 domain-containing protein [Bacteroidetes bacterium]|nr:DUF2344 domain-containing protein [Bacteroidota bacterium]
MPESLNGILPEGLRFLAVKKFSGRPEAIASLLDETGYTIYFGEKFPSDPSVFSDFMNRAEVEVIRFHKKKSERLNIRPFVKALQFDEKTKSLRVETRFINGKTVKLKELFSALFTERPDYFAESTVIRTGLWALRSGKRLTPMEV